MLAVSVLFVMGWLATDHFPPWVSWHSELLFFIAAAVLLGHQLYRARKAPTPLELPCGMAVLVLMLIGIALLQWFFGQLVWHAQLALVFLYLVLALSGISSAWAEARAARDFSVSEGLQKTPGEWLAWTILLGASASLLVAAVQVFQLREAAPWMVTMPFPRRPGGNLAQPNHLATLLVMALASACYLKALSRIGWTVLAALALLMLVGVAMTESRTGVLAALCLSAWLSLAPGKLRTRSSRWFGFTMAVATVILFALWPHFYRAVMGDVAVVSEGIERLATSGRDPRVIIWSQLLDASMLKPWLGWGFLNTAEAHHAVSHLDGFSMPLTYSHNLVLDLVLWLGWPLALLVSGCGLYWLITRIRAVDSSLGWFGFGLLLPLLLHSLLEFPFVYAYLLLPSMLGLGYVEGAHRAGSPIVNIPRRLAETGLAIYVLLGVWSVVDYVRVEEDFRSLRFQVLGIGNTMIPARPDLILLDGMSDLLASSQVPLTPSLTAEQLALIRTAALHHPWPATYYRYATALALSGDAAEARRQMQILRAQFGDKLASALIAQLNEALSKHQMAPLTLENDLPKHLLNAKDAPP